MDVDALCAKTWDALVIGTGIGGGTIGRSLAEAGLDVLFVEYGPYGPRTEAHDGYPVGDGYSRMLHGIWPSDAFFEADGTTTEVDLGLGAGVGGTSAFYAATLERPSPQDLDDSATRPHPTGGWPVSFAEFDAHFTAAERMYHVVGERNPLEARQEDGLRLPEKDTGYQQQQRQFFEKMGLHPYRSPTGAKFLPGCDKCFGRKCPRACKMDGRTAGVEPALKTGHAAILDWCEAVRFHGEFDRIETLEARHKGRTVHLKAKRFILSAGALNSPRILQRSVSESWPAGCANGSGLVGRNLMFHLNELFALWSRKSGNVAELSKAFTMRDFYTHENQRLGAFQALGVSADYKTISHFLSESARQGNSLKQAVIKHAGHISSRLSARLLGNAEIYVGILEDFPHFENHVTNEDGSTDRIRIVYNVSEDLLARRALFTRMIQKAFPRAQCLHLNRSPQVNYAHACGTLRFGDNQNSSVLNRHCRSHEVQNLYCVDASFMPTSNGVNPSLTIAANALRVADHLVQDVYRSGNGI